MGKYDNLLHMEQPIDTRHPRMSLHNRAAQFAPFDALTGFSGRIYETSRLTDRHLLLSEDEKQVLDLKLHELAAHIKERPVVTVTYFVPDRTKDGGSYQTLTASVLKIDEFEERIFLDPDLSIAFEDLLELHYTIR